MNATSASMLEEGGRAQPGAASLYQIGAGRTVRVRELCASPELNCRLREIGFGEGQVIRLIACRPNLICQVCQARLALTDALAKLIFVEALG